MKKNIKAKTLTDSQSRFEALIRPYPDIYALWDFDRAEYIPDMGLEYLATASHGERVLAKFFVEIWLNGNDFDFDMFEAAFVLDADERKLIADWLIDPFWP